MIPRDGFFIDYGLLDVLAVISPYYWMEMNRELDISGNFYNILKLKKYLSVYNQYNYTTETENGHRIQRQSIQITRKSRLQIRRLQKGP